MTKGDTPHPVESKTMDSDRSRYASPRRSILSSTTGTTLTPGPTLDTTNPKPTHSVHLLDQPLGGVIVGPVIRRAWTERRTCHIANTIRRQLVTCREVV